MLIHTTVRDCGSHYSTEQLRLEYYKHYSSDVVY